MPVHLLCPVRRCHAPLERDRNAWRCPQGHAFDVALADYLGWSRFVAPGGVLVFHDAFEDPADGGQAPFRVWQRAVADGFAPVSTTGSLRILRR